MTNLSFDLLKKNSSHKGLKRYRLSHSFAFVSLQVFKSLYKGSVAELTANLSPSVVLPVSDGY